MTNKVSLNSRNCLSMVQRRVFEINHIKCAKCGKHILDSHEMIIDINSLESPDVPLLYHGSCFAEKILTEGGK